MARMHLLKLMFYSLFTLISELNVPGLCVKSEGNAQLRNTVNGIYIYEELNEVCLICTLQFYNLNIIMISM